MRIGDVVKYKDSFYAIIGYYDGFYCIQDKMEEVARKSKDFADFEKRLEPSLLKIGVKITEEDFTGEETLVAITSKDTLQTIYTAPEANLTAYVVKCRLMNKNAFKSVLIASEYNTTLDTYFKGFVENVKSEILSKKRDTLIDGIYLYAGKEINFVLRKDNKYYKINRVKCYADIADRYGKILKCITFSISPDDKQHLRIQMNELRKISKLQEIKVDENHLYFYTEIVKDF